MRSDVVKYSLFVMVLVVVVGLVVWSYLNRCIATSDQVIDQRYFAAYTTWHTTDAGGRYPVEHPERYQLGYPGRTKRTQDDCTCWVQVSPVEYRMDLHSRWPPTLERYILNDSLLVYDFALVRSLTLEVRIVGKISWNLFKVNLHTNQPSEGRRRALAGRFKEASAVETVVQVRGRTYRYTIGDQVGEPDQFLVGRLLRKPKRAVGRRLTQQQATEVEGVSIQRLYDDAEFVYDLQSCVLALRNKYPFGATQTTCKALTAMLGEPLPDGHFDVHVGIMREVEFTQEALAAMVRVTQVKLWFAVPNPDDPEADTIHEMLMPKVGAKRAVIDLKSAAGGIDVSEDGLVNRSVVEGTSGGYLERGYVVSNGNKIPVSAKEEPRELQTPDYQKSATGKELDLKARGKQWRAKLKAEIEGEE